MSVVPWPKPKYAPSSEVENYCSPDCKRVAYVHGYWRTFVGLCGWQLDEAYCGKEGGWCKYCGARLNGDGTTGLSKALSNVSSKDGIEETK